MVFKNLHGLIMPLIAAGTIQGLIRAKEPYTTLNGLTRPSRLTRALKSLIPLLMVYEAVNGLKMALALLGHQG